MKYTQLVAGLCFLASAIVEGSVLPDRHWYSLIQVQQIKELYPYLEKIKKGDLFIFDFDETVVTSDGKSSLHFVEGQETFNFIEELKKRECSIMVLTARFASQAMATFQQLKHSGIHFDFSEKFPEKGVWEMWVSGGASCLYKDGYLFCSGIDKGWVLEKFFILVGYPSERVWFIDDKLENNVGIGRMCARHRIPCTAFIYSFAVKSKV